MKKIFLAALTAMALCSYSYAQDDDDEYEEDEAPAASSAPAPAPAPAASESSAKAAPAQSGAGFMGLGIDIQETFAGATNQFYLTFKIAPNMELSAILGLYNHGETSVENKATGGEADAADDYTAIALGVGFDFFAVQMLLPISLGGEFVLNHFGEDNNRFDLNLLAGFRANLVANLYLTGKVGLAFQYYSWEDAQNEYGRIDVGFKTGVLLHWFFM